MICLVHKSYHYLISLVHKEKVGPKKRYHYLICLVHKEIVGPKKSYHYLICLVHTEKVGPKKSYHYLICLVHKEKVGPKKSYHYLICLVHKEKVGLKKIVRGGGGGEGGLPTLCRVGQFTLGVSLRQNPYRDSTSATITLFIYLWGKWPKLA